MEVDAIAKAAEGSAADDVQPVSTPSEHSLEGGEGDKEHLNDNVDPRHEPAERPSDAGQNEGIAEHREDGDVREPMDVTLAGSDGDSPAMVGSALPWVPSSGIVEPVETVSDMALEEIMHLLVDMCRRTAHLMHRGCPRKDDREITMSSMALHSSLKSRMTVGMNQRKKTCRDYQYLYAPKSRMKFSQRLTTHYHNAHSTS